MDIDTIQLCKKKVTTTDGVSFNSYFAYLLMKGKDGKLTPIEKTGADGKSYFKSIRVHLGKEIEQELLKDNRFPYNISLKDGRDKDTNKPNYFVTRDKNKQGLLRLDKNGNSHYIIVINHVEFYQPADSTVNTLSLDDIVEDL